MSNYNGLIITVNHQFASNYTVLANYTYSKCLGNVNYGGDTSPPPQNPSNLAGEYGPCNFDVRHNLTLSGVAVTPKFKNGVMNAVMGGFQVSPLFSYRTGLPFSVETGTDVSLTGIGQDRANLIPGAQVYSRNFYRGTKQTTFSGSILKRLALLLRALSERRDGFLSRSRLCQFRLINF